MGLLNTLHQVNVVFCDGATGLPIEVPADLSTISREKLEGLGIRAAAQAQAREEELQVWGQHDSQSKELQASSKVPQ